MNPPAPNRIDPTGPPSSPSSAVSPTGTPVLPPSAAPWLAALVGLAATGASVLPSHTIGWHICTIVVSVGAVLGIMSPGVRRAP